MNAGDVRPWHPRSIRLPEHDYRSQGAYFITICAHERRCTLESEANRGAVVRAWDEIPAHFPHVEPDEFVIMPNHVHGVLWIRESIVEAQHAAPLRRAAARRPVVLPGSLGAIVRSFKSASTKRINELRGTPGKPVWQRNYYERVIRNEDELARIREYIRSNPLQWELDRENPGRRAGRAYDTQWAWLEGDVPERVPVAARR